ncbi:MAG: PASTA domain-containing protein [Lachnospiraceae bacterium]|nr:PASTA domain-containing protein [Lachnospiraceae bacterium]
MNCQICEKNIDFYPCPICGYDGKGSQNPHFLAPGTNLFKGRYRVGQFVGAGGFGVTYSAWDTELTRRVAVKEYMPGEFSTRMPGSTKVTTYGGEKQEQFEAGMLKFHDESERLAKFTEVPGIVQIYDCFYENDTAYIVMEFLKGETLKERLEREEKIPVSEAVNIMIPVLDALSEVHKAGIIHRDIAPNNIFLTSDGRVKLLDFGAARSATGSHSKSLTVLYKEGFTAEEQYQSRGNQGPWTDVYSAAATLYKAITGITPDGAMERRLKDNLIEPVKCGIKIDKNVNTAILNALNVSYKIRTQSAEEFKKELTGMKGVKKRFQRTIERRIGHIPKAVWITSSAFAVAILILVILQATGLVKFDSEAIGKLFNSSQKMINVVNLNVDNAVAKLEKLGAEYEIEELYSNDYLPDRVISQEPEKGATIDKVVKITVVRESKQVEIPDVFGMQWQQAEETLNDLHFICEKWDKESAYKPGTVLSTNPDISNKQWQGQTVNVYVSSGISYVAGTEYAVESMVGMSDTEAMSILKPMGIYLNPTDEVLDIVVPKGGILEQEQNPGTVLKAGTDLNVVVSSGIDEQARAEAINRSDTLMSNYLMDAAVREGKNVQFLEEVEKKAAQGDEASKAVLAINEKRELKGLDKVYPSTELSSAAAEIARLRATNVIDDRWQRADGRSVSDVYSKYGFKSSDIKGFHMVTGSVVQGIANNTSGADSFKDSYANPDYTIMGVGRYSGFYVLLFSY